MSEVDTAGTCTQPGEVSPSLDRLLINTNIYTIEQKWYLCIYSFCSLLTTERKTHGIICRNLIRSTDYLLTQQLGA